MKKRKEKQKNKTPTYNLNYAQIEQIKKEATHKAIRLSFDLMILVTIMTLRDHYGFGKKRLEEFTEHLRDMWDSYNNGYLNLNDIIDTIEEETGFKLDYSGLNIRRNYGRHD